MYDKQTRLNNESGFTLAEVLIGILILGIIIGGAFTLAQVSQKSWGSTTVQMELRTSSSRALNILTKSLRQARENTESAGLIGEASTTSIVFFANDDEDALPEKISYSIVNNDLVLSISQPTNSQAPYTFSNQTSSSVIAANVVSSDSTPLFSYYRSSGDRVTTLPASSADLQLINKVFINLQTKSSNTDTAKTNSLQTSVYLRNWKQ